MDNFDEKLESFVAGCNRIQSDYYSKRGNFPANNITVNKGRRYFKLVERGGESVYCFVDKTNGDVLKAASWSAPAKGARGNIFDSANGLARMGPYGAAYNN